LGPLKVSFSLNTDQVRQVFGKFGEIVDLVIIKDKQSGNKKAN